MMESQLPQPLRDEQLAVEAEIRSAFESVVRGDGVSWSESELRDGNGSDEEPTDARARDRDTNWAELIDDPNWIHEPGVGGFSFLDAQGFRYYIPAAMIRCTREGCGEFIAYGLTLAKLGVTYRDYKLDLWSLINDRQGRAIARFLRLMIAIHEHKGDDIYREVWVDAYNSHWRDFDRRVAWPSNDPQPPSPPSRPRIAKRCIGPRCPSRLGHTSKGTEMGTLDRLLHWYAQRCDGDWEHSFGIKIDTLDNPGWHITIDLAQTRLESATFETQSLGMDDSNHDEEGNQGWPWWHCSVRDQQFHAVCDPLSLEIVLSTFLQWSEEHGLPTKR